MGVKPFVQSIKQYWFVPLMLVFFSFISWNAITDAGFVASDDAGERGNEQSDNPSCIPPPVPERHLGMTIRPFHSEQFDSDHYSAAVTEIAETGFNYITMVMEYEQETGRSSEIYPKETTPSSEVLERALCLAYDNGLNVHLKMHLETGDGLWRARINADDREAWFSSYGDVLNHYAEFAEQHQVSLFTLGTELILMSGSHVDESNERYWRDMIEGVRERYGGLITYSANWGGSELHHETANIQFWDALDYIGIAAFYEFDPPFMEESLMNQWDEWNEEEIFPLYETWDVPILFTEIGYRAIEGALHRPWNHSIEGDPDNEQQALGYKAMFSYWDQCPWMHGAHLWEWIEDAGYSPKGRPAQDTLRELFATQHPSNGPKGLEGGNPRESSRC